LAPTALPTARAPVDFPRRLASALYETVTPGSSSSRARQTWTWKLVPQTASGKVVSAPPPDHSHQLGRARVITHEFCPRELVPQPGEFLAFFAALDECQAAQPTRGLRQEGRAERRGGDPVP
jgi:hypothetical protein